MLTSSMIYGNEQDRMIFVVFSESSWRKFSMQAWYVAEEI